MTKTRIILAAMATLGATSAHAALNATYTDRAAWEASFGRSADLYEDFNTYDQANGDPFQVNLPVTYGPLRVSSETLVGTPDRQSWLTWAIEDNKVDLTNQGYIMNRLDDGSFSDLSITYTWDRPILAMGFDMNADVDDVGRRIDFVTDNGQSGFFSLPAVDVNEFRGFVFDTPFTSITLMRGDVGVETVFGTDNFAAFDVAFVPEPGGLALLGLGGLLLLRRRRMLARPSFTLGPMDRAGRARRVFILYRRRRDAARHNTNKPAAKSVRTVRLGGDLPVVSRACHLASRLT